MSKQKYNQRKEIIWNIVNSFLAGLLVFLGACTSGDLTKESVLIALLASGVVAVSQFQNFWKKEEKEYRCKTITFGTFVN